MTHKGDETRRQQQPRLSSLRQKIRGQNPPRRAEDKREISLGDKVAAAASASSIELNSSRKTEEKQLGDMASAAKSTLEQNSAKKAAGNRRETRQQQPSAAEDQFHQGRRKRNRREAAQKEIHKGKRRPKESTGERSFGDKTAAAARETQDEGRQWRQKGGRGEPKEVAKTKFIFRPVEKQERL